MADLNFWELEGYPKEDQGPKKFTAQRRLLVAWADRYTLANQLYAHPGAAYPYLTVDPLVLSSIRCTGIGIEPYGRMDGVADIATYDWSIVSARYESPDYGDPQPYPATDPVKHADKSKTISETLEPALEALPLDYRLFKWSDGTALKEAEAPVRTVYRMTYCLTRHYQTDIPPEALTAVGKINDATVSPILLTFPFPLHTLMFVPPSISLSIGDGGETLKDITYKFQYKEEGWRKFWRADKQEYQTIKRISAAQDYTEPAEADFSVFMP